MCVNQRGDIKVSDGTVSRWKVMRVVTYPDHNTEVRTFWEFDGVGEHEMELGTRNSVESGSGFCCFATERDALRYIRWKPESSRMSWDESRPLMKLRKYYIPKGVSYIDGEVGSQYYGSFLPASRARKLVRKNRLPKILKEVKKITKYFEIWLEGYSCTGESGGAVCTGRWLGNTFEEAAQAWNNSLDDKTLFDPDRMTHWGCRLYDNEADARRSFG